jgi:hypothetical protein
MPSNNIAQDSRTIIQNNLLEVVPTKRLPQVVFGLEAFALRPFRSGQYASIVVSNHNTANGKLCCGCQQQLTTE